MKEFGFTIYLESNEHIYYVSFILQRYSSVNEWDKCFPSNSCKLGEEPVSG